MPCKCFIILYFLRNFIGYQWPCPALYTQARHVCLCACVCAICEWAIMLAIERKPLAGVWYPGVVSLWGNYPTLYRVWTVIVCNSHCVLSQTHCWVSLTGQLFAPICSPHNGITTTLKYSQIVTRQQVCLGTYVHVHAFMCGVSMCAWMLCMHACVCMCALCVCANTNIHVICPPCTTGNS